MQPPFPAKTPLCDGVWEFGDGEAGDFAVVLVMSQQMGIPDWGEQYSRRPAPDVGSRARPRGMPEACMCCATCIYMNLRLVV